MCNDNHERKEDIHPHCYLRFDLGQGIFDLGQECLNFPRGKVAQSKQTRKVKYRVPSYTL